MKAHYFSLALLFLCFSCGTQTVSDSEKGKIRKEVKEQIDATVKALETANIEAMKQTLSDSPDFRYSAGGRTFDYKATTDFIQWFFGTLNGQKGEIRNEKIWVLDKSTALYVAESKWTMNFKDGRIVVQEPWVWENLLKKVDGKWLSIYSGEFGEEKLVANSEMQKELNQIELHKQFIGSWKIEVGKDTICLWDVKPYGSGFDCYFKYVTNGKPIMEGKQMWEYDKATDRYTLAEVIKDTELKMYASYFVTNSKCIMTELSDVMHPESARKKWEVEIKSPQSMVQNYLVANKLKKSFSYQRVK